MGSTIFPVEQHSQRTQRPWALSSLLGLRADGFRAGLRCGAKFLITMLRLYVNGILGCHPVTM